MADEQTFFKTIKDKSQGIFKEKGSKFFAYCYPVNEEGQINEIISQIKKQYHDARHHCYAYCIGINSEKQRANDDREPTNSAGQPILNQILAKGLTNILVVVVRYFGGKLLGVGGLINAYRSATEDALNRAELVKHYLRDVYEIEFGYPYLNQIMKIINMPAIDIMNQTFKKDQCRIKFAILKHSFTNILESFNSFENIELKYLKTI
jgi:uncharacterized YigZ family protein